MESLVNKRVRLRNRLYGDILVASSDRESVTHVKLDDNKPKPENSVWVIKSKNPDKGVQFESVYGKVLGWASGGSSSTKLTVIQMDKSVIKNKNKEETSKTKWHTWWTVENVYNNGFACVRIRERYTKDPGFLYPDFNTPQVKLIRSHAFPWWSSWLMERMYYWDLEIVETPTLKPTPNKPGGNPGTSSFPFNNYDVNSGHNNNNSGTQIVGDTNVQTQIGKLVNNYFYQTYDG